MKKVLIANRGEIAVRVIRACKDLGLKTVAVYTKADAESLHVLYADEAICIGEGAAKDSYLKISHIMAACEVTGADAIHPGYGFLSENADFAAICEGAGIIFIGPTSKAIAKLGDKVTAKNLAKKAGCPIIPGSEGLVEDTHTAISLANEIGYPLMIKSTAGGGGKGIRIVHQPGELIHHFQEAALEATQNFGNGGLYLEKKIMHPRHIEMQVIADHHGNYVYLGERDCTFQRRRQKLIEEAPSPVLTESMREKIGCAAINLIKEAGYTSVGTVEFLLDQQGHFYFMEVNTRIQVEHTVTEELVNIDLVKTQIQVAMGEKLPFTQGDIRIKGHIIQFRINAEDPSNHFRPSAGTLEYFIQPGGPHVRVDTAAYSGYTIPPYYDSMIAKLIVKGKTRDEAIAIAKRALGEFFIGGVKTTIPFHRYMVEESLFLKGKDYFITTIDDWLEQGRKLFKE